MEIAFDICPAFNLDMRETSQRRAPDSMRQEAVGERLRRIREAHGLKASEISDSLGVERTYWSRWERGARPIPPDIAYLLTQMFEVDLDYILVGVIKSVPPDLQMRLANVPDRDIS